MAKNPCLRSCEKKFMMIIQIHFFKDNLVSFASLIFNANKQVQNNSKKIGLSRLKWKFEFLL